MDSPFSLSSAARSLTAVASQLPTEAEVSQVIDNVREALGRGYFLPDEDEQVRGLFARYLRTRAALKETLEEMRPLLLGRNQVTGDERLKVFAVAFCTACMLMRCGRYLVDSFGRDKVIWKKLDEAEPRYGIPRKQYTKVYRSLSSPRNNWIFLAGLGYFEEHESELDALVDDPKVGGVIKLLQVERPFIDANRSKLVTSRLKYRLHSLLRRQNSGFKKVTFALFKLSGSAIAEMRMKWKRKRVTPGVCRKISRMLQPGDVIITRHDDAASNLFLPGYWPHAAYYIGTNEERDALGVAVDDERRERCQSPICILEAKKDGVLFRAIEETLLVDAFVVVRPNISKPAICDAISRALTHEGKTYDFEFDFRRSDKLVCTEVVYRAYHGIDRLGFELTPRAGRHSLSAEDILDKAVETDDFSVVAIYGVGGNRFQTGERAMETLIKSYREKS